jgi:hypothetical protein
MASADAVQKAHRDLGDAGGVTELGALEEHAGRVSFIFADLNRNWWELTSR